MRLFRFFATKIIAKGMLILFVSTGSVAFAFFYLTKMHSEFIDQTLADTLKADAHMLDVFFENEKARTRQAAHSMATNQEATNAIRHGDADEIIRIFNATREVYNMDFFIVCDSHGKVIARTGQTNNPGTSLVEMHGIRDALYGKVSTYFHSDRSVKLAMITSEPLLGPDGAPTAVISAGAMMDSPKTVSMVRDLLRTDGALFVESSIAAHLPSPEFTDHIALALFSEAAKQAAENGGEQLGHMRLGGDRFKTYYKPLLNEKNVHAAVLLFSRGAEMETEMWSLFWTGMAIAAVGMLLTKSLLFMLLSSISKQILRTVRSVEELANGNLNISFRASSRDEMGTLGRSLQKATNKIAKLCSEILYMISEHKKGNVSYRLITEDFRGQYETLAENILSLTNLSIKDRLTGLPNRRTLFSRLVMVMERAVKDGSRLSILLVDVDRFKQFGIDTGDAVLKQTAQMMSISIIQEVDMAARWAGDIFIVLLPNTDAEGAMHVAERIKSRVENCVVEVGQGEKAKMTVSIGVYTVSPSEGDTPDSLLQKATEALYSTKGKGGNVIALLEGEHPAWATAEAPKRN